MSFLKQVATMDMGGAEPYATGRLHPATEPTDTAYVNWKAKNYSATLRTHKSTETGYRVKFNKHQMWLYNKILKRDSKTNATRMAA